MLNQLQGKKLAYLYGLQKMSSVRPKEATHLAQRFFEKADLNLRLATFRTILFSSMGDSQTIGDLFLKLLAATTQEEREEIVEPFFESLLKHSTNPITKPIQNKLAWLNAYYYGWKTERVS